ncbi:MAG TPA: hypothetical protein DC042_05905 [Bacteroidales bacterium]|nr:hypothetical protein [Bacteroidales bacterium]
MKEEKKYVIKPDSGRHLGENELAQYAEFLRGDRDVVPEELLLHMEECAWCRAEAMEVADIVDLTDDGRPTTDDRRPMTDDGRPTTNVRRLSSVVRLVAAIAAVALIAWVIQQLRPEKPEPERMATLTTDSTNSTTFNHFNQFNHFNRFNPRTQETRATTGRPNGNETRHRAVCTGICARPDPGALGGRGLPVGDRSENRRSGSGNNIYFRGYSQNQVDT